MKIRTIPNINFKSDYYGFKKAGTSYWLTSIKTDDPPVENQELLLRMKDYKNKVHGDFPMTYDGKYYTYNFPYIMCLNGYEILNKKNKAGEKELNEFEINRKINIYDRLSTGRPAEKVISRGSAEGLLVTDLNNIPSDKPVILMIDKLEKDEMIANTLSTLDTNVLGIVMNNVNIGNFTHVASTMGQYFDVASIVYDDKKYDELKKLAGGKIRISNESGEIKFSVIDRLPEFKIQQKDIPNIPILDAEEKLLDFSELTRKNSGEKAYRLGIMQKLLKEGYLSDIEIPPGFVIPLGYINKIYEYVHETDDETERIDRILTHPMQAELKEACMSYGITKAYIRSAFNAEDLPDYPTAGIYDSEICYNDTQLVETINDVVSSKDSETAIKSRKRYGLQDSVIQPTVIVQQRIRPDYQFTLYTDTYDGKLRIETHHFRKENQYTPTTISYDKESKELKIEELPYRLGDYVIKDTGEIIEQHLEQDLILNDWKSLVEPFMTVVKNALKLEKYFGRPQDIEGGIKDGKVYFWQTRDIIKKAVKR